MPQPSTIHPGAVRENGARSRFGRSTATFRSLANAAALIEDNPALYKLRLLQEVSASSGNSFILDTEPPAG